jgi:Uncharacterized protein conserved in bacteria (DUF2252)
VLARAHARSGDAATINDYLGTSAKVEQAFVAFASAYADQNERDHAQFARAVEQGSIPSAVGWAECRWGYMPARSHCGSDCALVIGQKLSHVDEPVLTPCHESPKPNDERQRAQGGPPPRRRGQQFIDELLARRAVNHGW